VIVVNRDRGGPTRLNCVRRFRRSRPGIATVTDALPVDEAVAASYG
jgi:hypothetical protein